MDEGKKPAPWFLDVNGTTQGPYTSQEIMKLVMDGTLKIESKIFDSVANTWKLAAEVIPYLDLEKSTEAGSPVHQQDWNPPPRPAEFRNTHIVDLNTVKTGDVDYFALISDRKKELEKSKALLAKVTSARSNAPEETRRGRPGMNSSKQEQTNETSVQPTRTIGRVSAPSEVSEPKVMTSSSAPSRTTNTLSDPSSENVISFFGRVRNFFSENKNILSAAAALSFVFIGTYGVIRTIAERKGREPAQQVPPPVPKESDEQKKKPPNRQEESNVDALGQGKHRVERASGGVSTQNAKPRVMSAKIPANSSSPAAETPPSTFNNEPPRDGGAQYNTADVVNDANAGRPLNPPLGGGNDPSNPGYSQALTPQSPVSQSDGQPTNAPDPNSGVVIPPGYIPPVNNGSQFQTGQAPEQSDPNDPNRYPTNDPSVPPPN